jgi:hypothetical protein
VAAFHFGFIEQGGSSLYAALGQKVSSLEVLKITLGIGGDEIAHFLEWVDFAGNGVQSPVAPFKDATSKLSFPNFFTNPPLKPANLVQPSLTFPAPCEFINPNLPHVAVSVRAMTDLQGHERRFKRSPTTDCSPGSRRNSSTRCSNWRKRRTRPAANFDSLGQDVWGKWSRVLLPSRRARDHFRGKEHRQECVTFVLSQLTGDEESQGCGDDERDGPDPIDVEPRLTQNSQSEFRIDQPSD